MEADNDDDDDMVVGQAPLNVICPITKQRMTDPVKNNICKHIYEKKTTLDMIKMNRETKYVWTLHFYELEHNIEGLILLLFFIFQVSSHGLLQQRICRCPSACS